MGKIICRKKKRLKIAVWRLDVVTGSSGCGRRWKLPPGLQFFSHWPLEKLMPLGMLEAKLSTTVVINCITVMFQRFWRDINWAPQILRSTSLSDGNCPHRCGNCSRDCPHSCHEQCGTSGVTGAKKCTLLEFMYSNYPQTRQYTICSCIHLRIPIPIYQS